MHIMLRYLSLRARNIPLRHRATASQAFPRNTLEIHKSIEIFKLLVGAALLRALDAASRR